MNQLQKGGLEPLSKVPVFKYTFNEKVDTWDEKADDWNNL